MGFQFEGDQQLDEYQIWAYGNSREASRHKDFIDVSMFNLNSSWEAYFQGGKKTKSTYFLMDIPS